MQTPRMQGMTGRIRMHARRAGAALAVALAACTDGPTTSIPGDAVSSSPATAVVGADRATGIVALHWGDPQGGLGGPRLRGTLRETQGNTVQLVLDEALVAAAGGARAVNGRSVDVEGDRILTDATGSSVLRVRSLHIRPVSAGAGTSAVVGSKPYVTILCKFADSPTRVPRPRRSFVQWMGNTYPGLDHYWREMSYDQVNLAGSGVTRWYVLPRPRASYFLSDGSANFSLLADDCTGAADADVDFRQVFGVNTQFNETLDCCSWGGSYFLTRDGVNQFVAFTWMADWADLATYAHETGHSLGFPHSSGPYGQTYDSKWDVMSNAGSYYDPVLGTSVQEGTITYHRDLDGWIPAARKLVMTHATSRTIDLNALGRIGPVAGYLMVQIPLSSPGEFYTVETRDLIGYDAHLPGTAVVIHHVVPNRPSPAQVVDVDGNGDPNDAGAMWTDGETFTDPVNGVRVAITQRTATGFRVRVGLR